MKADSQTTGLAFPRRPPQPVRLCYARRVESFTYLTHRKKGIATASPAKLSKRDSPGADR